jgi:cytochrome c oxidase assembly factor CtaG
MSAPSLPSLLVSHWEINWPLDVQAALVAALYVWAATRGRSRWPWPRTVAFATGIGCVVVALQSGVDAYDERLLSAHMVQHMLLLLLAPLLLLAGQPVILVLRAAPRDGRVRLARALAGLRALTRPAVCLGAFSVVLVASHIPAFYDATLRSPLLHGTEHTLYLLAGLLLYWPLLAPDPAPSRRLGGLGRLIYMLAAMPAMALIGAYLNRHPTLVYAAYGAPGRALGISPVADQAQAGAVMWVLGSVIMTTVGIWTALAGLSAEERRQQLVDARTPPRLASPPEGAA